MPNTSLTRWLHGLGLAAVTAALALGPGAQAQERQFKSKDCMECHGKFAEKMAPLKYQHTAVKQKKCEECHLRHGLVPRLVMKQPGNALCTTCHKRDALGLDKPFRHTALISGSCLTCHDPHGSNEPHLLKAKGAETCYACHKREPASSASTSTPRSPRRGAAAATPPTARSARGCSRPAEGVLCGQVPRGQGAGLQEGPRRLPGGRPARPATIRTRRTGSSCSGPRSTIRRPAEAAATATSTRSRPSPSRSREEGNKLCAGCHEASSIAGGKVVHLPVKKGECLSCHDPHASDAKALARAPGNALCAGCHKAQAEAVAVPHKVITAGAGCVGLPRRRTPPRTRRSSRRRRPSSA